MSKGYRITVKEMPEDIQPRERLQKLGPEALSAGELLAIILRIGNREETSIEVANKIIHYCGGLKGLASVSEKELANFKGVGTAKIAQIRAAIELGSRIYKEGALIKEKIRSPLDVVDLVMEMQFLDKEHFKIVLLSTKNHVIGTESISVGSLNSSIVHPREVFKKAIEKSAASIILVHNHPSGDPQPSNDDIKVTKRLVEAGELLGISVLDHIIIGDSSYKSLKEMGVF